MRAERHYTRRLPALAALVLLAAAPAVRADSIWDRRQPSAAFLYADNLAAEVGDSLTVLVSEQSAFKQKADRSLEKTTTSSATANFETPVVDLSIPAGTADHDSSRTFDGSLDYNGTRTFTDSITVTVVDKLPNGNLVVGGRSNRQIAGEEVSTVLSGIVKPEDVAAGNTVSSARIAYLSVYYETSGSSESFDRDGWLSWIINFVWPF